MDPAPETITWKTTIGWLALAVLIAIVATPIAIWVGPGGQPVVIRLGAGVFCASIVYRLAVVIRARALIGQMTPAEVAMQPRATRVQIDPLLARLAAEVRSGFPWRWVTPDLWSHLLLLCQQRGAVPPATLMPQPGHPPTWQDVERMIRFLEDAT